MKRDISSLCCFFTRSRTDRESFCRSGLSSTITALMGDPTSNFLMASSKVFFAVGR